MGGEPGSGTTPAAEPLLTAFARHLQGVGVDRLSARALDTTRAAIVDTVGVTLAGAAEPAAAILWDALRDPADAGSAGMLVIGTGRRARALDAVLINGTAAHAVDYDDMAAAMGGHPSVPIVPVILALGEQLHASGRDLIDAYVVGFEAECRLGRVVHPDHYDKGWHPTSTMGVFGAAAAAARLMRLEVEQTAVALALCASVASGVKANFGTMAKPFHAGHAARDGLMAAMLAARDFTANPGVLEHKQGFLAAYDGLSNTRPERLLPLPGDALEIEGDDIGVKQFPCCGSTHPAILAMLTIAERAPVDPDAVESIEIRTHPRRLPHTDNPHPSSPLGAKFSIQYATVRALLDGPPRLRHFEGEAFREPAVERLLGLTRAFPLESVSNSAADQFTAEVRVTLRDGSLLQGSAAGAMGRGPLDPLSESEAWAKFGDCAAQVLTPEGARTAFDLLAGLETLDDTTRLTDALEAAARPAG